MLVTDNMVRGGYLWQNTIVDPVFIVNGVVVPFPGSSGGGGSSGAFLLAMEPEYGDEMVGFPGVPGPTGAQGLLGPQGLHGIDGADGEDAWINWPGPQGVQGVTGAQGPSGPATHLLVDAEEYQEPIVMTPFVMPLVDIAYYAPGSFFLPDGSFAYMLSRLILTGSQECDMRGTSRLCIEGAF